MSKLISVGRLIDESWELYRARFHELMSVSAWLLLLAMLYIISLSLYPSASTLWFSNQTLSPSENIGVVLFILTNYVAGPLLGIWVVVALCRLIKMHLAGRSGTVKKAIAESKPLFLPTVLVSIMVGFLIVLAILIGFGPSIIVGALGAAFDSIVLVNIADFLLMIGIFVGFILSFRWLVEYYLTPYVTILEGTQGKKAMAETRVMVQGKFWAVLVRLVVPKLVFLLFGVFCMAIISYFTEILLDVVVGLNVNLHLRLTTMIEWIIPILIGALVNPLVVIADILLYKDLKGE